MFRCCLYESDLVNRDKEKLGDEVAIKRGSIISCLSLPSASWIGQGFWALEGAGGLICMYGVTKRAFGAELIRQHKPTRSTVEDVSACDIASHPAQPRPAPPLTYPYPPPHQPQIYSVRKQTVTLPTPHQSHIDLRGVNVPNRRDNASDVFHNENLTSSKSTKVSSTLKSGRISKPRFTVGQWHRRPTPGLGCGTKPRPNNAGAAEGCDLETAADCDNSLDERRGGHLVSVATS
ncbi:unnamed protein product [Scomber scombrus]|uniref:Unnamed protein product n=1 Tax=Scomber scombrus TaxID=13677 RepID=A0AAV1PHB4_SCOSC